MQGGGSYRRSVPLEADKESAARKIVGALGYTGVMLIELKIDRATGRWVLIELNGRFWGALALAYRLRGRFSVLPLPDAGRGAHGICALVPDRDLRAQLVERPPLAAGQLASRSKRPDADDPPDVEGGD